MNELLTRGSPQRHISTRRNSVTVQINYITAALRRHVQHYNLEAFFPRSSYICFTEGTERGPMDGDDNDARRFPLPAYCCIPLQVVMAYIVQHRDNVAS